MIDEYRRGDEQRLVGHLSFSKFSPSILKSFLADWRKFRGVVTAPIFVSPKVDDDKFGRFITLLGFRPIQDAICNDGKKRRLFIHTI